MKRSTSVIQSKITRLSDETLTELSSQEMTAASKFSKLSIPTQLSSFNPSQRCRSARPLTTAKAGGGAIKSKFSHVTHATHVTQFTGGGSAIRSSLERTGASPEADDYGPNKKRFISALKKYLFDAQGEAIFEQLFGQLPASMVDSDMKTRRSKYKQDLAKPGGSDPFQTPFNLTLDLDLIDMLLNDPFLGENFMKCLFRYYSLLSTFCKDIFLLKVAGIRVLGDEEVSKIRENMWIRLSLRLKNYPKAFSQIDPKLLLSNQLLMTHGQLLQLKHARVVNVHSPQYILVRRIKKRACHCSMSPPTLVEATDNPMKVFKNFMRNLGSNGAHQYEVINKGEGDSFCEFCNMKYLVVKENFAPCQKIEILENACHQRRDRYAVDLRQKVSVCWLMDPFINAAELGDLINLTAFYFSTPEQRLDANGRCTSKFAGMFVGFDLFKINPFNQIIDQNPHIANLIFKQHYRVPELVTELMSGSTMVKVFDSGKFGLNLSHIKNHEQGSLTSKSSFVPKMSRFLSLVDQSCEDSTCLEPDQFPIFDALYVSEQEERKRRFVSKTESKNDPPMLLAENPEDTDLVDMPSFNEIFSDLDSDFPESQASTNPPPRPSSVRPEEDRNCGGARSSKEFRDDFFSFVFNLQKLEDDFSRVHRLVDRLFSCEEGLEAQNSHLFHIKLSLVLSSIVHLKNTLVRYLDFEISDQQQFDGREGEIFSSQINMSSTRLTEQSTYQTQSTNSCSQGDDPLAIESAMKNPQPQDQNTNLLIFHDDTSFMSSLLRSMEKKGLKITEFPTHYDLSSIVPFLLLHDHSILVVRNPKKDVLPILKQIIRNGTITPPVPFKGGDSKSERKPIRVNFTLWVFIDIFAWLDKLQANPAAKKGANRFPRKIKEVFNREMGDHGEFINLFDLVLDGSQHSHVEVFGSKYLKYQQNYILETLASCLEGVADKEGEASSKKKQNFYEFRELKCRCKVPTSDTGAFQRETKDSLAFSDAFLQYYYISQRRIHARAEVRAKMMSEDGLCPNTEATKMTLTDLVRVKKLADNIAFLRLFYFENKEARISMSKANREGGDGDLLRIDLIDCVLAVFLYEASRVTRAGRHIYNKEIFQYHVVSLFMNLRAAKVDCYAPRDAQGEGPGFQEQPEKSRKKPKKMDEIETDFDCSDDSEGEEEKLDELIENLEVQAASFSVPKPKKKCKACRTKLKASTEFKMVYKRLIQEVLQLG